MVLGEQWCQKRTSISGEAATSDCLRKAILGHSGLEGRDDSVDEGFNYRRISARTCVQGNRMFEGVLAQCLRST